MRIERPKSEKRQRVKYSRKAGKGGEGARARLEVEIKPSARSNLILTTRTTAPPGKKWNALAKKCI